MTSPAARSTNSQESPLAHADAQLRTLHELRVEARLRPEFEPHYVAFVRALRERLHPRGQREVRRVAIGDGLTFAVDLGDRLGCDVYYGYYDERFEASLFAEVLEPNQTMFDVGANFGYFTMGCAKAVGPNGIIHAFEPDPEAAELLATNSEANGFGQRVTIHRVAVSDQDGEVSYHLAEEPAFSGVAATGRSATRGVVTVPARNLDSVAAEHGIHQLDALKIDVEGHEAAVLRGAAELLRRSRDPLVMIEVSAKNLTDAGRLELIAALSMLFALGYHGLVPDLTADGALRSVTTADEAAGLPSANLLLARAGGERERRIRTFAGEKLRTVGPALDARPADRESRALRLFSGLDPDLVAAALRDKVEAEGRAAMLAAETGQLRGEISRLRAERAALRAEVRRLGTTPFGLAVRAVRKLTRQLPLGRR